MVEHSSYIARKRARFSAFGIPINIPWGTHLTAQEGFIYLGEQPLCTVTSQIAFDYFTQDAARRRAYGRSPHAASARRGH